ncbi:hypothetical protein P4O66_002812 [Electrophorus voltai]|uniref:Uncharacterized protein n=1 Tax=Electrophorus voltai TaxID=2609070 RepID=A0AAD8YX41_9TELE|nr:hypothetical protein P4O66_002812 [Electrophorus voltai]
MVVIRDEGVEVAARHEGSVHVVCVRVCVHLAMPAGRSARGHPTTAATHGRSQPRLLRVSEDDGTQLASIITAPQRASQDAKQRASASHNPTACLLGPIPSALFQTIARDLLPFITVIINNSLSSGYVPTAFKTARVVPILKKATLDSSSVTNYRPDGDDPMQDEDDPMQDGDDPMQDGDDPILPRTMPGPAGVVLPELGPGSQPQEDKHFQKKAQMQGTKHMIAHHRRLCVSLDLPSLGHMPAPRQLPVLRTGATQAGQKGTRSRLDLDLSSAGESIPAGTPTNLAESRCAPSPGLLCRALAVVLKAEVLDSGTHTPQPVTRRFVQAGLHAALLRCGVINGDVAVREGVHFK